ncbi:MAG TPA: phage tail sheath subtilisin-like domain-containing protein [Verrucomicrobiales bacterium]|nr:phage tail sheath subtilisin-like domain-containing protein [Verrucomicrobiales bacterium]
MPIAPTYPGVYIEEIPSGVRTITGVATSITAFLGRARQGPVNEPVRINNFADFERTFGGLWVDSPTSYAVRSFYLNGGSAALIVRLTGAGAGSATIELPAEGSPSGALELTAANAGSWGNGLSAAVNHNTSDPLDPVSPPDPTLFNLIIFNNGVEAETYLNVTMEATSTRYLPRVLEQAQSLVQILGTPSDARPLETVSGSPPENTPLAAADGDDGDAPGTNVYLGSQTNKTGIFALEKADLFNLLCIPPATRGGDTDNSVYQQAMSYCVQRRAMLIVDPPLSWGAAAAAAASTAAANVGTLGLSGPAARNAALYFPRVRQPDPERDGQIDTFVPCGMIAGIMARTDTQRGVWKAPAGLDAALNGIQGLQVNLTDDENGQLNPLGINCLRSFPVNGRVVWGARTLRGADQLADEYKYVPVRRLALFLEESLYRGTQWVVFEPNDEPLWAQIRLNVGAFMHNLFRQGAFQGTTPQQAYLVKCDAETTTQYDIDRGIVNILVGFAPLKPAEFVIIKIQQLAGQSEA